jgi:AcrR family transcriptional regulator
VVAKADAARSSAGERLEQTRVRLLDAVIGSLAESGYAATSTTEIARRSGLTRGAQLHHFGTKDHMMIAAVEHLSVRANSVAILAALDQMIDPDDRMRSALGLLAAVASGPQPAAYVELWVASRAHPELVDALRAADVIARDTARALFGPEILDRAEPEFDALLDLTMYALRGMALDSHVATEEERQARQDLIVGLARYLDEALQEHGSNG